MHFREASMNTAFESRPQSRDGRLTVARARTPTGHGRISLAGTEKVNSDSEPLLRVETREEEILLPTTTRSNRRGCGYVVVGILWFCSIVLTAGITYTATKKGGESGPLGDYWSGWSTDLRAARSSILVQKQQLHGSPDFRNRRPFIPPDSPSIKYIGAGDDIDAAWDELTANRYWLLTDEEAREAYGEDPSKYWNDVHGGYVAGLDVLHTLHCLDHLRKWLYPQHYTRDIIHGLVHQEHCIDHFRQLTMCQGDLTPVPTQFFEGLGASYINSSRPHTCRDFSTIKAFSDERFNGSLRVKPRNRDGSPREEFFEPWHLPVQVSPVAGHPAAETGK